MSSPDLSARLSQLSPAARLLLESRLRGASAPAQIPRLASTEPSRLSCAQERLWFLQQWDPTSSAYNSPLVFRLRGLLDPGALQRSLDSLVVRHEVFRTRFTLNGDAPCQTILPPEPVQILHVDLTQTHGEEQESSLRAGIREQVERVFDLGSGRLLRAALFVLAEDHHVLALATHHIVWDGWSRSVLLRELETLYGQSVAGHAATLDPLPIQYRDFAAWQRSRLDSGALARELAYWTGKLRGAPHVLELPADLPRPVEQSFAGATHVFTVETAMVDRLRAIARAEGATLFVALLAAFAAVIHRWTERDDFIIGAPIAGRHRLETEGLIGCFINTLALRMDVSGQVTYLDVLRRVRQTSLDGLANAELPFEQVIEAAGTRRSASHSPLVQVMFALQNTPRRTPSLHGLEVRPLPLDYGTSKLDLTLEATETPDGLSCAIEFNTELFELPTITRLAERWQAVLATVSEDPHVEIGRVPVQTMDERRLLASWNSTDAPRATDLRIHDWIERQTRLSPRAVAVVSAHEQVTYADLDRRANQLAQLLCREGAKPGALVGVWMDRSIDQIVALLAILKSGAAYVPLDRAYPDDRLAAILAQARPMMVLCDAPLPPATAAHAGAVLNFSAARTLIAQQSSVSPDVQVAGDDLAYVLFTSGSTGIPKGVMMPHAPVCNRIDWLRRAFPILASDRVLHHTSISFDVSVGEIFCALAAGATLVLADLDGQRDPAYLAGLIATERVTVVDLVPRMLQALLDEPAFARCGSLRQVHCGAETLPPEVARLFLSRSTATLLNFYGPTETCIDVTAWRCEAGVADRAIPIGRPIGNVRIHILDRERRPVAIGQPGEIYIGGAALARGYLNRPDLTAEAFVANPIDPEHSTRLYRTGDIGRYRQDGAIEFLGRRDHQVKIRGNRIELGEIEARLRLHPHVEDAVVTVREDTPHDKRLVAYVRAAGAPPDFRDLRAHLAQVLPDYMLPAACVVLDQLPLTANGKVDHRALPAPQMPASTADPGEARTPHEAAVSRVWTSVLNLAESVPVGLDADFFSLGGHSLAAARVMARLRDICGVTLPLRILFEAPTVRALAAAITARTSAVEAPAGPTFSIAMHPDGSRPPFFFLHAATEGDGFYGQQLGRYLGSQQPFYSLSPLGLDGSPIPATVVGIARKYVQYVRERQPHGPYRLGGFCLSGPVVLEIARQLRALGETTALIVVIESRARNVSRRARLLEKLIAGVDRCIGLDERSRLDLFLAIRRLAGWRVPPQPGPEEPIGTRVAQHYLRVVSAYVPEPSNVRLVHLHTSGCFDPSWGRVTSRFTDRTIPGDHDTCVTEHLGALAMALGRCLDESRKRKAPRSLRSRGRHPKGMGQSTALNVRVNG